MPLCTRQFGTLLQATDPSTLPPVKITGTPSLVLRAPASLTYTTPSTNGPLTITLVSENQRLKIGSLDESATGVQVAHG